MDPLVPQYSFVCGNGVNQILEPRAAMAMVPELDESSFQIAPMGGGLTNRVYKLSSDHATYTLRLDAVHTESFGLDRVTEISTLAHAASAGLAPEVIHSDISAGILLLRFIEGRVWNTDDLSEPKNMRSLAELLRVVHGLPASEKKFDAVAIAAKYVDNLHAHPDLSDLGQQCFSIISETASAGIGCCCHNDVVAANVIACPGLKLLDWEYTCNNEPLFDLASVIAYHRLGSSLADALLSEYAGGTAPELREGLATQIRLFDALHWLWLASRQVLSPDPSQANQLSQLGQSIG